MSLTQVCRQTRIPSLGRIENGCYEDLPSENYVAAFVRQYARTLGIPEAELVTARYLDCYRTAIAS